MFTSEQLSYHCDLLREAHASMLKANAVRRIIAELTLVRMCDERLSTSPEAMLSRISALENGAPRVAPQGAQPPMQKAEGTTQAPAAEAKAAPAKKRPAPVFDDDDDMFRGDAPGAAPVKPQPKPAPQPVQAQKSANVLRPFKQRAEVMEMMDRRASMISSFFKRGKWYVDDAGRMVLRFTNDFDIYNIKNFKGEQVFASVVSQVTGKTVTVSDLILEHKSEAESHDVLDEIIGSADN
jgi:hypothetical protein